jgi:hypothetical protein
MIANDVMVPLSFIARIICRIQINGVCRTKSRDVDHNRLRPCQCEMRHATGLGVEVAYFFPSIQPGKDGAFAMATLYRPKAGRFREGMSWRWP